VLLVCLLCFWCVSSAFYVSLVLLCVSSAKRGRSRRVLLSTCVCYSSASYV